MNSIEKPLIAIRYAFTRPRAWRAAMELVRRGDEIQDRKRHWFWEWIALKEHDKETNNKTKTSI